jgi:hypothetical protein
VTAADALPAAAAIGVQAHSITVDGHFNPTTVIHAPVNIAGPSTDYPKLGLLLIEPKDGICTISPARSAREDIQGPLAAAAAAKQMPSREWLADALAPIRDRVTKAKETLDADKSLTERDRAIEWFSLYREVSDARNELEEYALAVEDWYKHTALNMVTWHRNDTFSARRVRIVLEIFNTGRSPAESVEVNLFFKPDLPINASVPSRWNISTTVPVPPADFVHKVSNTELITSTETRWYSDREKWDEYLLNAIQIFEDRNKNKDQERQMYHTSLPSLQHGQSRKLQPIHISFEYNPAVNFNIGYKLHATNQPEDATGEVEIHVKEE